MTQTKKDQDVRDSGHENPQSDYKYTGSQCTCEIALSELVKNTKQLKTRMFTL